MYVPGSTPILMEARDDLGAGNFIGLAQHRGA